MAIGTGVVVWVRSERQYVIYEEGKTPWWTNDLPLAVPEVLTEQQAAIRAERFSKCRGPGKCYSWCKAKRQLRHRVKAQLPEDGDA